MLFFCTKGRYDDGAGLCPHYVPFRCRLAASQIKDFDHEGEWKMEKDAERQAAIERGEQVPDEDEDEEEEEEENMEDMVGVPEANLGLQQLSPLELGVQVV